MSTQENERIVKELGELISSEKVITDKDILREELMNHVGYRRYEIFKGQYVAPLPICVVKPDDEDEVSKVLSYLNENKINCIPKTGKSGSTGGGEPGDDKTVIIDGSGMNEIIKLDEENMLVTVKCGTPIEYLENYCNKKGYTTGHIPQSFPLAQIGGLIATRSIGQFSTLYGGIEDMVVGLKAVLPNGKKIEIRNVPRRASGPDIRHLFIGSEGALAFITEATLKIHKYNKNNRWINSYAVKDMDTGLKILQKIMTSGYKPAVARLHDETEAQWHFSKFVKPDESILFFLVEGPEDIVNVTVKAIENIAKEGGARSLGEKPVEIWLNLRFDCNETMFDNDDLRNDCSSDTLEVSANWSEIGQLYKNTLKRIEKEDIPGLVSFSGHSSHSYLTGTNIYFIFLFKCYDDIDKARETYFKLIGCIIDETLKLGGSMSHHHGIGKFRVPWIKDEHGSSYILLKMIKDVMDPNGIMNKGTLYPID